MAYNGFRFEYAVADPSTATGKQTSFLIAVAQTDGEATALAQNFVKDPTGIRLIGQGAPVLAEARKRGIADDQVAFV